MDSLKTALVSTPPSEKGGAIADERFGFQKDWAICKLLELHKSEEDYLMVFEYHDDVLVLDKSENPNKISFYQIKTKASGNWTLNALIKIPKGKSNSFLGKLYSNRLNFQGFENHLNFVSNARYKFRLKGKGVKKDSTQIFSIGCNDLHSDEAINIKSAFKKEFPATETFYIDNDIYFVVTEISIHKSEDNVIAALAKYFEEITTDIFIPKLKPLYEALHNEIRRKSKYAFDITSFEELVNCRSFTRDEFQKILNETLKSKNLDPRNVKNDILSRLNSEKVSMKVISKFNRYSNDYLINQLDVTNEVFIRLEKEIQQIITSFNEDDFDQGLIECAQMVHDRFKSKFGRKYSLDENYVFVVILFRIYGNHTL